MNQIQEALTFDDILIIPTYSAVLPKQAKLATQFTRTIDLGIPIVGAAMDTVMDVAMATALARQGGIGILHRHVPIQEQASQVIQVKSLGLKVGAAVGVDQHSKDRVAALHKAGVDAVVIDTAHGHSQGVLDMVAWIKKNCPNLSIIAGNIVTASAALDLVKAGADAVKVGIGPGAACTTRIITGVGYPQFSAIANVAQALQSTGVPIIADGGIRYSGDISKALAAGASTVMLGKLLAGTDEAPGTLVEHEGKHYKTYRGMHSAGALADKHSTEDDHFAKIEQKLVPEGAEGKVAYSGSVQDMLYQLMGGLQACMGYTGSMTIQELQKNAQFVRITNAGMKESHAHDIIITKQAPNYRV